MKVVILAGGLGTRLSEETDMKPKPMVEIGGKPILWHIMKIFSTYNLNDFVICCGYKGFVIKEYFANYYSHHSDVTYSLKDGGVTYHHKNVEQWNVTIVDTGLDTATGGRLKRVSKYLEEEDTFCLTYGDGLADVQINSLIDFHHRHKKFATVTATRTPGRYGVLNINDSDKVENFQEKPTSEDNWISGGFFILNKEIFNFIDGDDTSFENDVLPNLAKKSELAAFKHSGFWQPMDTLKEKIELNKSWEAGTACWKTWK